MEWPSGSLGLVGDFEPCIILRSRAKLHLQDFPEGGPPADQRQFGAGRAPRRLARLFRMQINPFRIEQYFGKYEFTAKYLLSSSDAESRTIKELLDLEPGALERLLEHWCGYTESPGAPWLREAIAAIYKQIQPGDILVVAAAEEA